MPTRLSGHDVFIRAVEERPQLIIQLVDNAVGEAIMRPTQQDGRGITATWNPKT
jgi:hypothetical protein